LNEDQLVRTVKAMVAAGKGILAADESTGTITKRFGALGIESTPMRGATIANSCFENQRTPWNSVFRASFSMMRQSARPPRRNAPRKADRGGGRNPGIKVDAGPCRLQIFQAKRSRKVSTASASV